MMRMHPASDRSQQSRIDTTNSIVYGKKRLITTIGIDNLIVVETDDAILVCDKNRAQDVKKIVDELKKRGETEFL